MIGRLILLSILVGVILAAIGLDPWNIIESVRRLIEHVWNMGFDAVRWLWRYFLLGAVIVVPIWFLVRLAKAPRGAVAAVVTPGRRASGEPGSMTADGADAAPTWLSIPSASLALGPEMTGHQSSI